MRLVLFQYGSSFLFPVPYFPQGGMKGGDERPEHPDETNFPIHHV